MQEIYPKKYKEIFLEVFLFYMKLKGEYFDITNPSSIIKETFRLET